MKPNAIALGIVEGREGNADMANMACLESDFMKECDDVGAERYRECGSAYLRELEAIVKIK